MLVVCLLRKIQRCAAAKMIRKNTSLISSMLADLFVVAVAVVPSRCVRASYSSIESKIRSPSPNFGDCTRATCSFFSEKRVPR